MAFELKWLLFLLSGITPLLLFFSVLALNAGYPEWWADLIFYCRRAPGYLRNARRRARVRKGMCPECGYDLRGNLSGFCPECGAEIDFLPPRILHRRG